MPSVVVLIICIFLCIFIAFDTEYCTRGEAHSARKLLAKSEILTLEIRQSKMRSATVFTLPFTGYSTFSAEESH